MNINSIYDKYKSQMYSIRGAAMKVHATFGHGFIEKVYQDAFEIELQYQGIPYEREKHITLQYRDRTLAHDYYADFVCYGNIIVELKATTMLTDEHRAQTINYINATNNDIGMLINFGEASLVSDRLVNTKYL